MKKLIIGTLLATSMIATAFASNSDSSGVNAISLLQKLGSGASVTIPASSTKELQKQLGASEAKQSEAQSQVLIVSFNKDSASDMAKENAVKQNIKQQLLYCELSKNISRKASAYVCALDEQTAHDNSGRS